MQEIIVKREDEIDLSLEIIENKYLRVSIRECGEGIEFMDFTLEEIDELQEAISIMKDKLQRNLSNKKEIIEFELPKTMSVKNFEDLIGCKTKPANQKIAAIVTPTVTKDDNFNCEIVPAPDFSLIAELTGGKLLIESVKNDSDNVVIKGKIQKNDTHTEQKDVNIVSDNEQKVEEKLTYGGEISDFPIKIVERMLECQVEQGFNKDVSVFERNKIAGFYLRGFDWCGTKEGIYFWLSVIHDKNFDLFFKKYPKKQ